MNAKTCCKCKKSPQLSMRVREFFGAASRNRTGTVLRPGDFKSRMDLIPVQTPIQWRLKSQKMFCIFQIIEKFETFFDHVVKAFFYS